MIYLLSDLSFVPGTQTKVNYLPMRSLCAKMIGSLVSVKAIVVRTSDVKPYLKVACYSCDVCGNEIYQIINSKAFLPLVDCASSICKTNQSRGRLNPQTRASKFVPFQELRVQEPSDQVPIGHVPRTMTIIAIGECVKQASPGELISVHGIYLPTAIAMSKNSHKSKLLHESYIEAFKVTKQKPSYKDTSMNSSMISMIDKKKESNKDFFTDLARSIAPEIYGLEDIKKALLILLVGGVNIDMEDGMKIRGNINILLLGDPGVAKSQILKFIANISPRGVYTTGKGSSGVGLTAAVLKDPVSSKE